MFCAVHIKVTTDEGLLQSPIHLTLVIQLTEQCHASLDPVVFGLI